MSEIKQCKALSFYSKHAEICEMLWDQADDELVIESTDGLPTHLGDTLKDEHLRTAEGILAGAAEDSRKFLEDCRDRLREHLTTIGIRVKPYRNARGEWEKKLWCQPRQSGRPSKIWIQIGIEISVLHSEHHLCAECWIWLEGGTESTALARDLLMRGSAGVPTEQLDRWERNFTPEQGTVPLSCVTVPFPERGDDFGFDRSRLQDECLETAMRITDDQWKELWEISRGDADGR